MQCVAFSKRSAEGRALPLNRADDSAPLERGRVGPMANPGLYLSSNLDTMGMGR
jgi:hypothetical protein